jgi:short chain dehydrogenase
MTTKSTGRSSAKDINRAAAPFAVVTGASTGIGLELARQCAAYGYDLLIVADEPEIEGAAQVLQQSGRQVEALEVDLATTEGVDALLAAASGRPIDALLANAGRGLGRALQGGHAENGKCGRGGKVKSRQAGDRHRPFGNPRREKCRSTARSTRNPAVVRRSLFKVDQTAREAAAP